MKKLNRRNFLQAVAGTTALGLVGCSSTSDTTTTSTSTDTSTSSSTDAAVDSTEEAVEKVVFKVGLNNPEGHPLCNGVDKFHEILAEKSGGKYEFEIYYGGSLGSTTTMLQSLQTGVLDIGMGMSSVISAYGADDLNALSLPFLFDGLDHAKAFQSTDDMRTLLDSIQDTGTKMVALGTYQESARSYFFTKARATSLADIKGLTLRIMESELSSATAEALGMSPIVVTFSELYSALQTGMVDAADQPYSGYYTNMFQEVTDYFLESQHEIAPNIVVMSEITWTGLSEEDQAMILEAFTESQPYFYESSDATDEEYIVGIADAGVEFLYPDDPDEWRDAVASVHDVYSADYQEIFDAIAATTY